MRERGNKSRRPGSRRQNARSLASIAPPSRRRACSTSAPRRNCRRRPAMPCTNGRWSSSRKLFDNALDACEEAGIAPEIAVRVDDDRHHDRRQRARPAGEDGQVDPRLLVRVSFARGLCVADARRAGQCAEDHPRDAVRAVGRASSASSRSMRKASATSIDFAVDQIRQAPAIGYSDRAGRPEERHRNHGPVAGFSMLNPRPVRRRGFYKSPTTMPGSTRT